MPAFGIDRRPATCDELKACERTGACSAGELDAFCDGGTASAPFNEAQQYCEWRQAQLPTVAQWQLAARGPQLKLFPWGSQWKDPECNEGSGKRCVYDTGGFEFEAGTNPYEWTSDRDCAKNTRFQMASLPLVVVLGAFQLDKTRPQDPSAGAGEFRCARQVIDPPK
ncbi:MAG: SUMF1/EgtB/PvdO family nonheme iron enzyme [Deltaproteobacteria bacterium]|nr:SUMF1/EgtB/PvdO family nonheme iron enzyme [Deltaproteobacteria bacterium]